ncbi:cytochrome P450 [Nocardia tenerifensis]|uniref:Cytochrome P450 n=1 Tax=Nocardia tenerifensis TaxID=228006 RepID=A0A318KFW2_9NOCA|nr:cytochrome P450 [Nocardia tenerifensis]PXX71719.1 cytochrome P450 [Nocardia tenerifensis]
MQTTIPVTDIDPYSDESIRDPYPDYRRLRTLGPVVRLDGYGVFAVARYREVKLALRNHRTFSSAAGVGITEELNRAQHGSSLTSDPPYHTLVRGLVSRHLTPKAINDIEDLVQQWADQLVEELIERDGFDAVTDFGQAFPLAVVPELLGWPDEEGRVRLLNWAAAGFNALGPMNARTMAGFPLLAEMGEFLGRMSVPGNLRPGSWGAELVTEAVAGKVDERLLPALLGDFLAPSMDTSVSALASTLWLLGAHPDQWASLRAEPALIPNAFNEILRLESPLRGFTRLLTEDAVIGDTPVPAGSRVLLLYGSANRDERYWAEPDRFSVVRPNAANHLAFGHGIHVCVGQALARLEGHALLRALVARVRTISVGAPVWRLHNVIRGLQSLPVRLRA